MSSDIEAATGTPTIDMVVTRVFANRPADSWVPERNFDPAVEGGRARHRRDAVRLSSVARRECAPSSKRLA